MGEEGEGKAEGEAKEKGNEEEKGEEKKRRGGGRRKRKGQNEEKCKGIRYFTTAKTSEQKNTRNGCTLLQRPRP